MKTAAATTILMAVISFSSKASAQQPGNPTVGGPYGSRPTFVCSDLGGSYCYSLAAGSPIGISGGVLPYMDNAARNWGCDWNVSRNAAASLGNGSWSKWYGNESDPATGCGLVYWSYAQQAAYFLANSDRGGNVAAAAQGATATGSSTFNAGTPAAAVVDGNRRGNVWGSGGGWSSLYNPTVTAPQWVQVNLSRTRSIHEIVVTTLQDGYTSPIEPTPSTTFTTYGIRDYSVQYWNGSAWVVVGSASGNDKVLRRFTFPAVSTSRIKVQITAALQNYARVVEVEAYEAPASSSRLLSRYTSLGQHAGFLGYPVSNPTPYGTTGTTYQQFARGVITYIGGQPSAFHAGGTTREDKALADRYAEHFGISPTTGGLAYGLARDVSCTNDIGPGCGPGTTGRYLEWLDTPTGLTEMIIARAGSATAAYVPGSIRAKWIERYGATAPWNGELGFPITDLQPTGSATYHQEFEKGTILWEPTGCSSGAYTARIVTQFRRPIFDSNLTMLCESAPPPNGQLALPGAAVPFALDGRPGRYTFRAGPDETGWFQGVLVAFDGGSAFDVTFPFYSAWIGGAGGGGNVWDALTGSGAASDWGEPTGSATCSGNPCTLLTQAFKNGVASFPFGGEVGFVPDPGLKAPTDFGPLAHGYISPVPPADRRTPIPHRSGDFIRLVWRNQSTLDGVTTRLYRSVTPLNGSAGPWQLVQAFSPPTLPAGTFTAYVDTNATNNARNCYYLNVSDGSTSTSTTAVCAFTLDGTTDANGIDRSAPHGVSRAQIRIDVPDSPDDSGTVQVVGVGLELGAGGYESNSTGLDSTEPDFTLGSSRTYDLPLTGVEDISDITGIVVTSHKDNLRVRHIELRLNNQLVFTRDFQPPVLVSNSGAPGGRTLHIGFDELRSNPLWANAYSPTPFLGFTPADFASKLDGILANAVFNLPGAEYHGSRLQDGHPTVLTKRAGYFQDRLHVTQHITASAREAVHCTLDYDLRITARDINGNSISPFHNGPAVPGSGEGIYTTEIHLENAHPGCASTPWKNFVNALIDDATPFPAPLAKVESDIQAALDAQGPSQIQSAPPPGEHFCFPRGNEGVSPLFGDGGLTVCVDQ